MPVQLTDWFLTSAERGNAQTGIDARHGGEAWTSGNSCVLLVHGARYFPRLHQVLSATGPGDSVYFTDWRGDADERLAGPGTETSTVLAGLARRGVRVHGLVWRSHPKRFSFSEQENSALAKAVNDAGGEVLLDERVRRAGSHHQKLFVIRHPSSPGDDVAFVGGIDLCHGRNDDASHHGDRQALPIDARYGARPAWHDLQMEVRGPAVGDLDHTFAERWCDPVPLDRGPWGRVVAIRAHERSTPSLLPRFRDPPAVGSHRVQVLRTYPARRPPYGFAPAGERSIARAYLKAFRRARRLIYIEDQYLWSADAATALADALRRQPTLRVVVVLPRFPDEDGRLSGPPNRIGQLRALKALAAAGGDRFAVYDLERSDGVPIYVHAKVCVIDDVWMAVGSDNVNRRSWTHDSELSCTILDDTLDPRDPRDPGGLGDCARVFARDTRLALWAEHLATDRVPIDPDEGYDFFRDAATALDEWHRTGRGGPRPPGRLRHHRPDAVAGPARAYGALMYRFLADPDGRPFSLRLRHRY